MIKNKKCNDLTKNWKATLHCAAITWKRTRSTTGGRLGEMKSSDYLLLMEVKLIFGGIRNFKLNLNKRGSQSNILIII